MIDEAAESYQRLKGFDLVESLHRGGAYIPGLDGLRAVAVTIVMVAHFGFQRFVPGGLGVTIFFFISGFLITSLLIREADREKTVDLRSFYVRRFLRLGPELYAFLFITLVYYAASGIQVSWSRIFAATFYYMNYFRLFVGQSEGDPVHWGHLWSLAVEEHFYLTFPLIVLVFAGRPNRLLQLLAFVIVVSPVWRCFILASGFPDQYTYMASDARFDSIAWGCAMSILVSRRYPIVESMRRNAGVCLFVGLAILLITLAYGGSFFRETIRYSMQGLSFCLLLVGLYYSAFGAAVLVVLEHTIMRWLGKLSYGSYLWHFFLLSVLALSFGVTDLRDLRVFERAALVPVLYTVTTALSALSYHFIHNPVISIRKRWGSHARA